ncbi:MULTISPECIES: VOC family protein [Chryseobacterium]|uniref:Bleomycin resistance family protein n=2 Tax=Chryseobacterium TaxID=59732 RepID=A0ABX9XBD1_9FLAO|nr:MULTISPECIES: VOC family protein [Chryseobacterium]MDH5032696.1 VOC family protein [Chryseobacterium cucumeris]RKE82219.1 putative glyoxalase superfamily protein PhnB [Chryseobacterium sp. AG363]ROH96565.1 bleomycin resistance family protein [Chryseobacterium cucumeris]
MTQFTALRPVFWTENLDETITFYMNVLGFTLMGRNDDWQWASLRKNDIYIMLSQPNEHENNLSIGFSGSFYFNVNQVDDLWEDLKTKAKVCYEIETFEWGMREFAIYDNNGYILQFGEPVDNIGNTE